MANNAQAKRADAKQEGKNSAYRCMHCDKVVHKGQKHNCIKAKADLIAAIEAAAEAYFATLGTVGFGEHGQLGKRFLAYLEGRATFVEIGPNGRYEPPTCGTDHLIAERALSLLERSHGHLAEGLSHEAVEAVTDLAERAGVYNARMALRRFNSPSMIDLDDDVPF